MGYFIDSGEKENVLFRDDSIEVLEIKIVGKEEKNMFDESKVNFSILSRIT